MDTSYNVALQWTIVVDFYLCFAEQGSQKHIPIVAAHWIHPIENT